MNMIMSCILIVFTLILCNVNLCAQSYTLEPLDSVLTRIQQNSQHNQSSRIISFEAAKSPQWYHLLPTIGYNAFARGISINFNLSSIISISDKKRTQQYQKSEWIRTEDLEVTKKTIQAKTTYKLLQNELEKAIQYHQIAEIDSIAHLIKKKAYENHKINTEEYYDAKRKYLTHQNKIFDIRQRILEIANQISQLQQKELLLVAPFISI